MLFTPPKLDLRSVRNGARQLPRQDGPSHQEILEQEQPFINQDQLTPKWHDEKNLSLSKPEAWGIGDEEKTAIGVFKEGQMLHSL